MFFGRHAVLGHVIVILGLCSEVALAVKSCGDLEPNLACSTTLSYPLSGNNLNECKQACETKAADVSQDGCCEFKISTRRRMLGQDNLCALYAPGGTVEAGDFHASACTGFAKPQPPTPPTSPTLPPPSQGACRKMLPDSICSNGKNIVVDASTETDCLLGCSLQSAKSAGGGGCCELDYSPTTPVCYWSNQAGIQASDGSHVAGNCIANTPAPTTADPTPAPTTADPTPAPTTPDPTPAPTTADPTPAPTRVPSAPTGTPSGPPTPLPTPVPTQPTPQPTPAPTAPTSQPSRFPTTEAPTANPTTKSPTSPTGTPSGPSTPLPTGASSGAPTPTPSAMTKSPTLITGNPSAAPTTTTAQPTKSTSGPTARPTRAGVPGCASGLIVPTQAALEEATVCACRDLEGELEDGDCIVPACDEEAIDCSPTVNVTIGNFTGCPNSTAAMQQAQLNPGGYPGCIIFRINFSEPVLTRSTQLKRQCEEERVQCEWYVEESGEWSSEGCNTVDHTDDTGAFEGATCVCDHLTMFVLAIRSLRSGDPFCAAAAPLAVLAAAFLAVGLLASGQICRICSKGKNNAGGGGSAKAQADKRLLMYHGVVVCVCVGRAAVLLLLNALYHFPGLVVLLAQLPLFAESALFVHLAASWVSAGVFAMRPEMQKRSRIAGKLLITLSLLLLLLFPALLSLDIPAGRQDKVEFAELSALLSAVVASLLAIVVAVSGFSVSAAVRRTHQASYKHVASPSRSSKSKKSGLAQKMFRHSAAFGLCFVVQACLLVASVSHAGVLDELPNTTLPLLHGVVEVLALIQLLLLFSNAVQASAGRLSLKSKSKLAAAYNGDSGVEMNTTHNDSERQMSRLKT